MCGEHIRTLVCLVVSLGICNVTNIVSGSFNTSRNKEEAWRPGAHSRDATLGHASGRDAPPRADSASATPTAGTHRSRGGIR